MGNELQNSECQRVCNVGMLVAKCRFCLAEILFQYRQETEIKDNGQGSSEGRRWSFIRASLRCVGGGAGKQGGDG